MTQRLWSLDKGAQSPSHLASQPASRTETYADTYADSQPFWKSPNFTLLQTQRPSWAPDHSPMLAAPSAAPATKHKHQLHRWPLVKMKGADIRVPAGSKGSPCPNHTHSKV